MGEVCVFLSKYAFEPLAIGLYVSGHGETQDAPETKSRPQTDLYS